MGRGRRVSWAFYPVLRSLGFIPRTKDAGE